MALRARVFELEAERAAQHAQLERLRTTSSRYQAVVELTPDYIFLLDPQDRLIYANPSAARIFSLSPEELLGRKMLDLFPADTADAFRQSVARVWAEGTPRYQELRHTTADGDRWLGSWLLPLFQREGRQTAVICICRDVTDRVRDVQQLRAVLAHAPVTVWVVDRNRRINFCAGAGLKAVGLTSEEIVGRKVFEVFPSLRNWEAYVPKLRAGGTVTTSSEIRGAVLESHLCALLSSDGEPAGIIGVSVDVTGRVDAERALERELSRIERLESLGQLAGGFAHDFNNLLTAILGSISVAARRATGSETISRPLAEAERATLRARQLTRQLLTFARGGAPLTRVVRIEPLVDEATSFALRGSPCRAEVDLGTSLWTVEVDESQIGQVLQNILLNAQQAMAQGGTIDVTARNVMVEPNHPLPLEPGRYVVVEVLDRGQGIPEDQQERVFDPYYTTKPSGTGLGLATAHTIVRRHRGHIGLESVPGRGTTVRVYLPATDKRPSSTRNTAAPSAPRRAYRVLVMDDEPAIRHMMKGLLGDMGFDVEVASDGGEAIGLYEERMHTERRFEVVVLDLTVAGGMGGRETMARLRALDPYVRAIVSSGYSEDLVLRDYRDHGFRGVARKPYRPRELAALLKEVLEDTDSHPPPPSR